MGSHKGKLRSQKQKEKSNKRPSFGHLKLSITPEKGTTIKKKMGVDITNFNEKVSHWVPKRSNARLRIISYLLHKKRLETTTPTVSNFSRSTHVRTSFRNIVVATFSSENFPGGLKSKGG